MYQQSTGVLIFLAVTFLVIVIILGVLVGNISSHATGGKL